MGEQVPSRCTGLFETGMRLMPDETAWCTKTVLASITDVCFPLMNRLGVNMQSSPGDEILLANLTPKGTADVQSLVAMFSRR